MTTDEEKRAKKILDAVRLNTAVHAYKVWERAKARSEAARKTRDKLLKLVPVELYADYKRRVGKE